MSPTARRLTLLALGGLGLGLLGWLVFSSPRKPDAANPPRVMPTPPPRGPRGEPRRAPPRAASASPTAVGTAVLSAPSAEPPADIDGASHVATRDLAPGAAAPRTEQLRMAVFQQAVRHDWVSIDERGNPCPPDRIRIVYSAPDLSGYTKGAYFEPLGPSPGETVDEVNGMLLCEGHTYLYRGFEAYYRAERGQWDVFPFPVIE